MNNSTTLPVHIAKFGWIRRSLIAPTVIALALLLGFGSLPAAADPYPPISSMTEDQIVNEYTWNTLTMITMQSGVLATAQAVGPDRDVVGQMDGLIQAYNDLIEASLDELQQTRSHRERMRILRRIRRHQNLLQDAGRRRAAAQTRIDAAEISIGNDLCELIGLERRTTKLIRILFLYGYEFNDDASPRAMDGFIDVVEDILNPPPPAPPAPAGPMKFSHLLDDTSCTVCETSIAATSTSTTTYPGTTTTTNISTTTTTYPNTCDSPTTTTTYPETTSTTTTTTYPETTSTTYPGTS